MLEKQLFKCDLNCLDCEKECELKTTPNKNEQLSKFDEIINQLDILNSNNDVINSLKNSISAFENNAEKIDFIEKCLKKYIKDLIKQNLKEKDDINFINLNFKKFFDYITNKILEGSK